MKVETFEAITGAGVTAIYIDEIPEEFLHRVRIDGVDDLNQPVRRYRSVNGGEPCRDVLRRARPGEELILASFSPFKKIGPFREFGPIYVLAASTGEVVQRNMLPIDQPEPEPYLRQQFVLRAYNEAEDIIDGALVKANEANEVLLQFLASPETAFVHARFPVYGCFACRINRL